MATKKTDGTKAVKTPAEKTAKAPKSIVKKAAEKKTAAVKKTEVIIQSPMGGNITPEAILEKVGKADKIYIRVDENKAYWVRGDQTGSVDLWD